MRRKTKDLKAAVIPLILGYCLLITTLVGCEALVRKFSRKPKDSGTQGQEIVLVPEEYSVADISVEER